MEEEASSNTKLVFALPPHGESNVDDELEDEGTGSMLPTPAENLEGPAVPRPASE